jgi:hypothetical protein
MVVVHFDTLWDLFFYDLLLLTRRECFLKLTVDKEIAEYSAGAPVETICPSFDAR